MQTIRFVYLSDQRPDIDYTDLTGILPKAVEHNTRNGITRVLVSAEGTSLQELEGERAVVNRLYEKILRDPRHHNREVLQVQEIDTRSLPDWSMKLVGVEGAYRRELLERMKLVQMAKMTGPQAREFLVALGESERGSAT